MTFWFATADDCPLLAELNHQLIQDEGHRTRMRVVELERLTELQARTREVYVDPVVARYAVGADGMWSPLRKAVS